MFFFSFTTLNIWNLFIIMAFQCTKFFLFYLTNFNIIKYSNIANNLGRKLINLQMKILRDKQRNKENENGEIMSKGWPNTKFFVID